MKFPINGHVPQQFVFHPTGSNPGMATTNTYANGQLVEPESHVCNILPEYRNKVHNSLQISHQDLCSYYPLRGFCDIQALPEREEKAAKILELLRSRYPDWTAGKSIEVRKGEAMVVFQDVTLSRCTKSGTGAGNVDRLVAIGVSLFSLGRSDAETPCLSKPAATKDAKILGANLGKVKEWTELVRIMPGDDFHEKYTNLRELLCIDLDGYVNRGKRNLVGSSTRIWCEDGLNQYIEFSVSQGGDFGDYGVIKDHACQARLVWVDLKKEIPREVRRLRTSSGRF